MRITLYLKIFILSLSFIIGYKKSFKSIPSIKNSDYNNKFAIIQRNITYSTRGLMAYYFINLGCAVDYIHKGYIPIIDLISHPNIFNGFNNTRNQKNPWEIFFQQPFNFKLEDIITKAKYIKYIFCEKGTLGPHFNLFENNILINYWHNIGKIYMPIKKEFINEASIKYKYLFKRSNNILGILVRGTDYLACKPYGHPIQPNPKMIYKDIIKMDKKYKYDYIFLTTEDDSIRTYYIENLGKKLKYIKSNIKLNYNYKKKKLLAYNDNIKGNIPFMRIYLINIIILSKCLDIITPKTGGSLVSLILSKGFRNKKIYNLGWYIKIHI